MFEMSDAAAPPSLRVEGYASLFDAVDLAGDVVRRGAFAASLMRSGAAGLRMLLQHEPEEPIGVWDEAFEDARGLFVRGRILSFSTRSDAARRLAATRALDGLSIGFRTVRSRRAGGRRELLEVDLWEVSIVTFPMLPGARLRLIEDRAPAVAEVAHAGA